MTSSRPYLIRALYEWIVDNDQTPHLLVDAQQEGVHVPSQHVQDGKIILNVAPEAVRDLLLGNDSIDFNARFNGQPTDLSFPISAVLAIYARENGQGMVFSDDEGDTPPEAPEPPENTGKPALKLVE